MIYTRGPCDEGTQCITVPPSLLDPSEPRNASRATLQEALKRHYIVMGSQAFSPILCEEIIRLYTRSAQEDTCIFTKIVAENNMAQIFYHRGHYEQALFVLGRSLDLARHATRVDANSKELKHCLSTVLCNIGRVHFALKAYDDALIYLLEALNAHEGVNDATTAFLWYNMALLLHLLGKGFEETMYALTRALEILSTTSTETPSNPGTRRRDIVTVQTLLLLVQAQHEQPQVVCGQNPVALLQALISQRQQFGYEHASIARTLCALGTLYMRSGEHDIASHFLAEALRVQRHLRINDNDILMTLTQLGQCFQGSGRHPEAMSCFRWALRTNSGQSLEKQEPQVKALYATILYNIGMIQFSHGNREDRMHRRKALQSFHLCLDLRRSCFGKAHPGVASVLHNIGILLLEDGKVVNSLECFQESLDIRRLAFGPNHVEVASSLRHIGRIHQDIGDYEKAMSLHMEALSILQKYPQDSSISNMIEILIGLGQAQHSLGRMDQALKSYGEAAKLLQVRRQNGHATANKHIARVLTIMGNLSVDMSDLQRAQTFFAEAARLSGREDVRSLLNTSVPPCAAAA